MLGDNGLTSLMKHIVGRDKHSGIMDNYVVPPVWKVVAARVVAKELLKMYTHENGIRAAKKNHPSSDDVETAEEEAEAVDIFFTNWIIFLRKRTFLCLNPRKHFVLIKSRNPDW